MRYQNLTIFRSAINLAKYIETIVKNFDRYSRYSIGSDLRERSQELLFLISKANRSRDKKMALYNLMERCDELSILLSLGKELESFRSFKQFEHTSMLLIDVQRQANGWHNSLP